MIKIAMSTVLMAKTAPKLTKVRSPRVGGPGGKI